jgi:hypothetical protein
LLTARLLLFARLLSWVAPLFQALAACVTIADSFACHFTFFSLAVAAYLAFFAIVVVATRQTTAPKVSYFRIAIIGGMAAALVGLWIAIGAVRVAGASSAAAACEGLCFIGPIAFFWTFRFEIHAVLLNVVLVGPETVD